LQLGIITPQKLLGQEIVDADAGGRLASQAAPPELQSEIEALRNDIRDLSIRIAEDQILANAGGAAFPVASGPAGIRPSRPTRTLADVPDSEVKSRLRDLATEMNAAQEQIAGELGAIAERTRANGDDETLRNDMVELGLRSQTLLKRLETDPSPSTVGGDEELPDAFDAAAVDIVALNDSIAQLEARAEKLSRAAVAARFDIVSDTLSPVERTTTARVVEQNTDGVIRTVFEAIERLNNIAAALARAGDAERQRKTAH